jgi:hypothetical protein
MRGERRSNPGAGYNAEADIPVEVRLREQEKDNNYRRLTIEIRWLRLATIGGFLATAVTFWRSTSPHGNADNFFCLSVPLAAATVVCGKLWGLASNERGEPL